MASTSSSHQQNAFSGFQPLNKKRKVESSRVYDVFINHRSPDVKQTLATDLYNSLKERDIRAFLDSEETELGTSFHSAIETAIRSAKVHIAIFSKGYAESRWCLAELHLMLQTEAKIIPVFYQVEPWAVRPSDLRHIETGVYKDAFLKYETKGRYTEKIKEWKDALQSVSFVAGYEFSASSDCKEIVSAVQKELESGKHLFVVKHPVGLDKLVEDFERKCLVDLVEDFDNQYRMNRAGKKKANVVGIFGMGGVGKTTLTKELFNQKRSQYSKASFLFDVREASCRSRLSDLQSELLHDLFDEKEQRFRSLEEGTSCLRNRLEMSRSMSFLIVLDDVDHVDQLEALLVMDILDKSSNNLIIITTRDVGILVSAGIDIAYHLRGLDREDASELFCWYAFNQPFPDYGYENLVQAFVDICGGLPLSLQVLARHVSHRPQGYWQDELEKFKKSVPRHIKQRLNISIDTLDKEEKQIFMDIACFFIGKSITVAMSIWKGSGWNVCRALKRLKQKCLVEEVEVKYPHRLEYKWESNTDRLVFRMQKHLRDMGREMADEMSHPRRLWRPEHRKYQESKGFRNILAQPEGRSLHSIVDKSIGSEITYFLGEAEGGSDTSLLWLQLEYLSHSPLHLNSDINSNIFSWIPLQYLQCLKISNGCFRKLWQSDVQAPFQLKELQIHDTSLEEFSDLLGTLHNLEKLVLHAKDIQIDSRSLLESLRMKLRSLQMMGSGLTGDLAENDNTEGTPCKSLFIYDFKRLWEGELALNDERWSGTVMNGIENLEINGYRLVTKILINGSICQRLQSLQICEMKNLTEVELAAIQTLKCLEITCCEKFKRLSAAAGDITKLARLIIKQCPELEELQSLSRVSCLEQIEIDSCEKLQSLILPTTITRLTVRCCRNLRSVEGTNDLLELVEFEISDCGKLEFENMWEDKEHAPLQLEELIITGTWSASFVRFPSSISYLSNLKKIALLGDAGKVFGIKGLPDEFCDLQSLEHLELRHCTLLSSLPTRFGDLRNLRHLDLCSCKALRKLPFSFQKLKHLKHLDVSGCKRIVLQEDTLGNITELEILYLSGCLALQKIPDQITRQACLRVLQLQHTSLENLPNNIGQLGKLEMLTIGSPLLQTLPDSLGNLSSLKSFSITNCFALECLPKTLSNLVLLEHLCIEATGVRSLPEGFRQLGNLRTLKISDCQLSELDFGFDSSFSLEKLKEINLSETLVTRISISDECCPGLETLRLSKNDNLEVIETLPATVKNIVVSECETLKNIRGILVLSITPFPPNLTISDCPELKKPSKPGFLESEMPSEFGPLKLEKPSEPGFLDSEMLSKIRFMKSEEPSEYEILESEMPSEVGCMKSEKPSESGSLESKPLKFDFKESEKPSECAFLKSEQEDF